MRRCSSPTAAQGDVWQWLNEGAWVSWERCWVCSGSGCCIPGVDIPVPASLEQSCPSVLPFGYGGCSSLSVDEESSGPAGALRRGKFYCSASLLGWNSASAAVLACSQRWANLAQAAGSIVMSLNKRKKKGRKKEGKAKLFNRTHKETCWAFPSQVWNWITMVKQPWMFFFFLIFF